MKKSVSRLCAAALAAVLMLAGCSNSNANSGNSTNTASDTAAPAKPARTTSFTLKESTEAGNSGNVTIQSGDTYAVISVKDFGDIKIKLYPDLAPYAVYNFTELVKRGDYNGRNFHRLIENFMIQGGSGNGIGYGGDSFEGGTFCNEINTSLRHYYGAFCYASTSMGDITDGFYIVNSKKAQNDLDTSYESSFANYTYTSQYYKAYLESITEQDPNYGIVTSIVNYNNKAAEAAKAMESSLTDAVKTTYSEKGGVPSLDGAYTVFGQTVEGFDVIDKITAVEKEDDGKGNISKPVKEILIDKIEIFTMP